MNPTISGAHDATDAVYAHSFEVHSGETGRARIDCEIAGGPLLDRTTTFAGGAHDTFAAAPQFQTTVAVTPSPSDPSRIGSATATFGDHDRVTLGSDGRFTVNGGDPVALADARHQKAIHLSDGASVNVGKHGLEVSHNDGIDAHATVLLNVARDHQGVDVALLGQHTAFAGDAFRVDLIPRSTLDGSVA